MEEKRERRVKKSDYAFIEWPIANLKSQVLKTSIEFEPDPFRQQLTRFGVQLVGYELDLVSIIEEGFIDDWFSDGGWNGEANNEFFLPGRRGSL